MLICVTLTGSYSYNLLFVTILVRYLIYSGLSISYSVQIDTTLPFKDMMKQCTLKYDHVYRDKIQTF